jgi:hypothetical protein
VQEIKDTQKETFTNTSSLACSTIECLPQGMHNSTVTVFNGKQDHTRSNKEVPPKDAQLLEGPNKRYEHKNCKRNS